MSKSLGADISSFPSLPINDLLPASPSMGQVKMPLSIFIQQFCRQLPPSCSKMDQSHHFLYEPISCTGDQAFFPLVTFLGAGSLTAPMSSSAFGAYYRGPSYWKCCFHLDVAAQGSQWKEPRSKQEEEGRNGMAASHDRGFRQVKWVFGYVFFIPVISQWG